MGIIITLIITFIITFSLFFLFIQKDRKKEEERDNIFIVILGTALLSLVPTAVIAFFLLALLGSTTAMNILFSLNISSNQLIILAIALLVYLFSIDSILENIVAYIIGKNLFYYLILFVARIIATYTIALMVGLNETNGLMIAAGASLIIFLLEGFYWLGKKNKKVNAHE